MKSLHGAAITWIFYDGSRHFILGSRVPAGCGPWSTFDPLLFGSCFESWIKELWPSRHDLIAIDGKTSRRTHDKRKVAGVRWVEGCGQGAGRFASRRSAGDS